MDSVDPHNIYLSDVHRNHSMSGLVYKFAKKAVRVLAVVSRFRFQKFCLFLFRLEG